MSTRPGMKVLLQNRRTRLFFCAEDVWTVDPDEAFDFQLSAGRSEFQEALSLCDSSLVLHFRGDPLKFACCAAEPR